MDLAEILCRLCLDFNWEIPIYLQFLVRLLFPLTSNIYAKDNQSDYYTLSD